MNVTLSLGPLIGFGDETFVPTDGENRPNTDILLLFDSLQFVERTGKGGKDHTQREGKKGKEKRKRKRRFLRQVAINGKHTPQMTVVYL
jgi:hypothetical protein